MRKLRLQRHHFGVIAIIAVQIVFLLKVMSSSWFYMDDFINFAKPQQYGLSRKLIELPI